MQKQLSNIFIYFFFFFLGGGGGGTSKYVLPPCLAVSCSNSFCGTRKELMNKTTCMIPIVFPFGWQRSVGIYHSDSITPSFTH